MVEVNINNKKFFFEEGLTVLQACEKANIHIPKFCFHEKLSIAGNCRMCLVEIEKSPKPVASCAMPLANGMTVFTHTPLVKKAREAVLEFLLINHPLDCPICDQGGECDLQDQSFHYGTDRSRHYRSKRAVEDKECGPIIKTIMTRCIHCTRCISFSNEIAGNFSLGAFGRGEKTEIGTYINKFVKSELSGNLVDLCPVGALTSKPYAFLARNWELKRTETLDYFDGLGSNLNVYTRQKSNSLNKLLNQEENKDEIMRILPKINENINEHWISDKSRYAFDGIRINRLNNILYNEKNGYISTNNWKLVIPTFSKFLESFLKEKRNPNLLNLGKLLSLDNLFVVSQFMKIFGSINFLVNNNYSYINNDIPLFYRFNSKISSIEKSDFILMVGTNPRFEGSSLNTRIRQHSFKNNIKLYSIGNSFTPNYNLSQLGNSVKTLFEITEGKHKVCSELRNAKNPLFIIGTSYANRQDYNSVLNLLRFLNKKGLGLTKKWSTFNHLGNSLTEVNLNELGVQLNLKSSIYDKKFSLENHFLIEQDIKNYKFKGSVNNVFNFNSYEINHSENLRVAFPIENVFEQENILFNVEGRIQKANQVISSYTNSRNIKDIFKTCVIQFSGINSSNKIKFLTKKSLLNELPRLNSEFFWSDFSSFTFYNLLNSRKIQNRIFLTSFKPIVTNFYMDNNITKNSQTMAECSIFLRVRSNFIDNYDV